MIIKKLSLFPLCLFMLLVPRDVRSIEITPPTKEVLWAIGGLTAVISLGVLGDLYNNYRLNKAQKDWQDNKEQYEQAIIGFVRGVESTLQQELAVIRNAKDRDKVTCKIYHDHDKVICKIRDQVTCKIDVYRAESVYKVISEATSECNRLLDKVRRVNELEGVRRWVDLLSQLSSDLVSLTYAMRVYVN